MRWIVVLGAIAGCVVAPTAAAADVSVNAFGCFSSGGSRTVPAGSTIVVRQGFAEQNRGVLTALLQAQTSTVSVDGGPAVDVSQGYSEPAQRPDGSWASFVSLSTGRTLAAGESLSFAFTFVLAHVVPEVSTGQPVFNSTTPQTWTCTVTAA